MTQKKKKQLLSKVGDTILKEGLSKKMPESEKEPRDIVRARAKRLTAKKKENFI